MNNYMERPAGDNGFKAVFRAMWRNWALAFGAIMVPMACALFCGCPLYASPKYTFW